MQNQTIMLFVSLNDNEKEEVGTNDLEGVVVAIERDLTEGL